jgi:23S rRNA (guanosine2251-2'-O)-methyltransferase
MIQLEGLNPTEEGLKQGRVTLIRVEMSRESNPKVKALMDAAYKKGITVETVSQGTLDRLSVTGKHQGIIAYAQPYPQWSLGKVLEETGREVCVLIIDQVQDPRNLGAILRTCDGAGVDGVVIPKRGAADVTAAVHRVSMGASLNIPVWQQSLYTALKTLKDEGLKLVALDATGQTPYFMEDLTGPTAFIVGGEDRGVNPTLLKKCDRVVNIPMRGRLDSLNVSVATAVVLYERLRQQENR